MRITMMLADHAAAAPDGKLYLNGAGWTGIGTPAPFGIGLHLEVPWDVANETHKLRLELLDSDGKPYELPSGPEGEMQPLAYEHQFETGRPPGMKHGTPIAYVHAVNFPPLPFEPNARYVWRLTVDEEQHDDWRLGFTTAPTFPTVEQPGLG